MKLPWSGRGKDRPPAAALALLGPEERVLSWADTREGNVVVATPAGLWWPDDSGPVRLPWHLVTHVSWSGETLTVTTGREVEAATLETDRPRTVRVTEARDLPETVEKRFYSSRVHSVRHSLAAGGGVVIAVRRVPGLDGLTVHAVYDQAQRRFDPTAHAEVQVLVAQTRAMFEGG